MKKSFWMVLSMLFFVGCFSAPVLNLQNESIPMSGNDKQFTMEEVEKAILSAAQKRGWVPRVMKPGFIEAKLSLRSHKATVEIPYTKNSYSINYKSSENLNYKNGNIHKNYNHWVANLSRTIQAELGITPQKK